MKKNIHIVIAESSDLLFQGLSAIFYQSEEAYYIYRITSFDEIEALLSAKYIDILLINPILIFGNDKDLRRLKKSYSQLLIGCVNMSVLDSNTLSLYDFTLNIYDNSSTILSTIQKQLGLKEEGLSEFEEDHELSDRETEVLLQIIKGHTNKEIADILNISVHTVISHRKNVMIKTGIKSQAGLALYAVSKSLISLDDFNL